MIDMKVKNLEFQGRELFHDLEYSFAENTRYVIFGKSGTGKTTLLHLILGYIKDFKGSVLVGGKKPDESTRRKTGFLLQSHPLPPNERVMEYCVRTARISGVSYKVAVTEAEKYLRLLNVHQLSKRKIRKLSGGEKQRVALCAELSKNPEVLLLDEPTGSIDGANSRIIYDLLKTIGDKTVIVVSHSKEAAELGKVLELKDGKLS